MPDIQRFPKTLCLIKYELDINVYDIETEPFQMRFFTKMNFVQIYCRKTNRNYQK